MILFMRNWDGLLFQTKSYLMIIKYWLKIVLCPENRLIKIIYNMMQYDMESMPQIENGAKLVKQLLGCLGFNEVWVAQTVGDVNIFLSLVKQRLHGNFIQNWNWRLRESSRASFYSGISSFHYQHYYPHAFLKKRRGYCNRLRPSVRPSVRLSIRPSVRPSVRYAISS